MPKHLLPGAPNFLPNPPGFGVTTTFNRKQLSNKQVNSEVGGLRDQLAKLETEVTRSWVSCDLSLAPCEITSGLGLFASKATTFGSGTVGGIFHILSNFYASHIKTLAPFYR